MILQEEESKITNESHMSATICHKLSTAATAYGRDRAKTLTHTISVLERFIVLLLLEETAGHWFLWVYIVG